MFLIFMSSVFIWSCTSTHNMKDGGEGFWGGGYKVDEVSSGVYRITAKTNVAPVTNMSGAQNMWEEHAEESCGELGYTEENVHEYSYEKMPPTLFGLGKYIVSVKEGLAVCKVAEK